MKVWTGDPRKWGPPPERGSAATVGVFDGVHEGHQVLLSVVLEHAALRGAESAVVTFDVHPRAVTAPGRAPKMLTTLERRIDLLEWMGVDRVGVLPFEMVRGWAPDEFIRRVAVDAFAVRDMIVGYGFRFGAGRSGDAAALVKAADEYDFGVTAVEIVEEGGSPISSSAVRRCIAEGDVSAAAGLLGRYHGLQAAAAGPGREARRPGPPSTELELDPAMAVPAPGVYAVMAGTTEQEYPYAGLCIIGASVDLYTPDGIEDQQSDRWVMFMERLGDEPSFNNPARLEQGLAQARRLLERIRLAQDY